MLFSTALFLGLLSVLSLLLSFSADSSLSSTFLHNSSSQAVGVSANLRYHNPPALEGEFDQDLESLTRRKMLRGRRWTEETRTSSKNAAARKNHSQSSAQPRPPPSSLKCGNQGDGKLDVKCELRVQRRARPSRVNLAGHIPFSCDYRGPRPHPPKNN